MTSDPIPAPTPFAKAFLVLDILLGGLMMILLAAVSWQVTTRYVFGDPAGWTEELAAFAMMWCGLLGAAAAYRRGAHVGVDVLTTRLSPAGERRVHRIGDTLIGLFAAGVLVVGGVELVRRTLAFGQPSPALGLEMGLVYLALPISGAFMALAAVERVLHPPERARPGQDPDSEAEAAAGVTT